MLSAWLGNGTEHRRRYAVLAAGWPEHIPGTTVNIYGGTLDLNTRTDTIGDRVDARVRELLVEREVEARTAGADVGRDGGDVRVGEVFPRHRFSAARRRRQGNGVWLRGCFLRAARARSLREGV